MKSILFYSLTFFFSLSLSGQSIPIDVELGEKNPYRFISTILWNLDKKAAQNIDAALLQATAQDMLVKDQNVYVEFVRGSQTDTDIDIDRTVLEALPKVEVNNVYLNRATAWIPVEDLVVVGQQLPSDYHICEVIMNPEDNQGPALMNSDSYSGAGGNGITICVIDGNWNNIATAQANGWAPPPANTTLFNYTGAAFGTSTSAHGNLCVQTTFDHAPNSDYILSKIGGLADMGQAVTDALGAGADVFSHSISRYNTGWGDNTGTACAAANDAVNNGALFFTSAGNRNGTHWQGNFNDPDNDNWHQWSGADEGNFFTMNGAAGTGNAAVVRAYLQWNSASSTDHYDLFLYNSNFTTVLASSTNSNNFETIIYSTNIVRNVNLVVRGNTANPPQFELFNHDSGCTDFQYVSTSGSTTSPSNSTSGNVISVGAVERLDYDDPPGTTGITASYSSRGPTNSGNQAPDIVAPTLTGVNTNGSFSGTSCSTPNAAGAAAAFWSSHSFYSNTGVRHIIFAKADLYKDWGSNGADNLYGRGGMFLHDYHINNRYIYDGAFNIFAFNSLPYLSIDQVDDIGGIPDNRIMIYLDPIDTAPGFGTDGLINKPMLYISAPANGTLID